jgi:hypothetical protein
MKIVVKENYQTGYVYSTEKAPGKDFDPYFIHELTPAEMLSLGVFGGNYFNEVPDEFPNAWFKGVNLSKTGHANKDLNFFKVNASQSLKEWQRKGWIYDEDPHGWFLWYCRYYIGRRIPAEDNPPP